MMIVADVVINVVVVVVVNFHGFSSFFLTRLESKPVFLYKTSFHLDKNLVG